MVHGGNTCGAPKYEMSGRTPEARKAGFEALQAKIRQEPATSKSKSTNSTGYGSWGSTFKSKDNFASLHHC